MGGPLTDPGHDRNTRKSTRNALNAAIFSLANSGDVHMAPSLASDAACDACRETHAGLVGVGRPLPTGACSDRRATGPDSALSPPAKYIGDPPSRLATEDRSKSTLFSRTGPMPPAANEGQPATKDADHQLCTHRGLPIGL